MTKIAFIPIDNRPICYDIIKDIINIDSSFELFMPNISLLGGLIEPSNIDKIFDFLSNLDNDIDYLIVSLDTLTYGGLVSSRRCDDSFEIIKNRVIKFSEIVKNKNCKVLAFSSIMRISNNNINEEEKQYWSDWGKKIFEYSFNLHKAFENTLPLPNPKEIPKEILDDYLNTRKRNFNINKLYIELAKNGIFDTLVFSKDDCAEYGFNVHEATLLKRFSDGLDNVFIKTGADEIPLSLLSRAISYKTKLKVNPIFLNPNSIDLISKYEDLSVKDCICGQLSLAGVDIDKKSNINFIINNFKTTQGDLVLGDVINVSDENINLSKYLPYFAADINNANGADSVFCESVLNNSNLKDFYGYCGYNTSANSIGCAICMALVKYNSILNNTYNELAFKKLQFIRFLDDYIFQAIVRKPIRENSPDFINALNNKKDELNNYAKMISDKLQYYPKEIKYSLPWNRSFEIRIEV